MKTEKSLTFPVLAAYVIAFYGIWTAWTFWGRPLVTGSVENECVSQLIRSGAVKNLVWTLPALLLIHSFGANVRISLREMFTARVRWLSYLPVFAAAGAYILAGALINHGRLEISAGFGVAEIITVLFVGITEETVFRGWLLNATLGRYGRKWVCIGVNALMFLAIHFPVWICDGKFVSNFTGLAFLEVMALSVLFSCTFTRSRSILVPVALHMFWDLLVFMLI